MMRKNKDGESSHETVNKVPFLSLKGRGEGGFCFGYLIVILCMMMMIFILAVWFRKTRVGTNFLTKSVTVLDVTVAVMLEF